MIRSAGEGDLEPHLIPPIKSHVRVDVHYTGYTEPSFAEHVKSLINAPTCRVLIEPIDENRTRLTMMTNCDPKVRHHQGLNLHSHRLISLPAGLPALHIAKLGYESVGVPNVVDDGHARQRDRRERIRGTDKPERSFLCRDQSQAKLLLCQRGELFNSFDRHRAERQRR